MKKIGILKEINNFESRVALNEIAVNLLKQQGHTVYITNNAGLASGIPNSKYEKSGGKILASNSDVIKESDIIIKVLAPSIEEANLFKEGQILFSFLNLITNPILTSILLKKKVTAIGYESINDNNRFPVLETMSKLVGKQCFQIGASLLSMPTTGKGVLLGGSSSASRSKVVIFGGGHAGKEFMKLANNAGSRITVFDQDFSVINDINDANPQIQTMFPYHELIIKEIKNADLILGATFSDKSKVKKMLSSEMIKMIEPRSVLIDLTAERGGISETTRLTTLKSEIYLKHDVFHYCVPNIAASIQKTASSALSPIILNYLLRFLITTNNNIFDEVIDDAIQVINGESKDYISLDDNNVKNKSYNEKVKNLNKNDEDIFDEDLLKMIENEDFHNSTHELKEDNYEDQIIKDIIDDENDETLKDDIFGDIDFNNLNFTK